MRHRSLVLVLVGVVVLLALAFVVRHHGGGVLARLAPAIHGR